MINLKKAFIFGIFAMLLLLLSGKRTEAAITGKAFGGHILHTEATEITALKATHNCVVPGKTITIKPIMGPVSYFYATPPVTKTTPQAKQGTIGIYGTPTVITCTLKIYPFTPTTVSLSTITLWGTSKK